MTTEQNKQLIANIEEAMTSIAHDIKSAVDAGLLGQHIDNITRLRTLHVDLLTTTLDAPDAPPSSRKSAGFVEIDPAWGEAHPKRATLAGSAKEWSGTIGRALNKVVDPHDSDNESLIERFLEAMTNRVATSRHKERFVSWAERTPVREMIELISRNCQRIGDTRPHGLEEAAKHAADIGNYALAIYHSVTMRKFGG